MLRRLSLLCLLIAVTGCAHLVAPLSTQAVDRNHGNRTLGARLEDAAIEYKTGVNLLRSGIRSPVDRVVVVSWNGQVLLAGQVVSAQRRQRAEDVARDIRHVVHVHNELVTGPTIQAGRRARDCWITTQIKMRLLFLPDVPGRRIKVVSENGIAYLMGLVTEEEGAQVTDVARNTSGVEKIVKIFEYIGSENAPNPPTGERPAGSD